MIFKKVGSQRGFSLVELMVVVAIIAVLASIAMPRFRSFQAKARQSEAKGNLAQIYSLEQSYHGDKDRYANMAGDCLEDDTDNNIGFYIPGGCKLGDKDSSARYHYEVNDATTTEFLGKATSGEDKENRVTPGCKADVWTINQEQKLESVHNSITACK